MPDIACILVVGVPKIQRFRSSGSGGRDRRVEHRPGRFEVGRPQRQMLFLGAEPGHWKSWTGLDLFRNIPMYAWNVEELWGFVRITMNYPSLLGLCRLMQIDAD